jgi:uncharacterized membrane protein YdjX (TVP38/TMEM64 family)
MANNQTLKKRPKSQSFRFDRVSQGVWIAICLIIGIMLLFNPSMLTPDKIQGVVTNYGSTALFIYISISMFRGFFLIPSTPFVLAGVAMYPENPIMVISISMAGILFSATLLYFFSQRLGFSLFLERKYPSAIKSTGELLSGNWATTFIAAWSVFPFVPTDVICYVAGMIKMPYHKMLLGLFIGEFVLISAYVYLGKGLISLF